MKTESYQIVVHALTAWRAMPLLGYIDPGTGSYGYQLLIAGVTGVLFFFTSIKRKVLSLFNKAEPAPGLTDPPPTKDPLARDTKDQSAVR